MNASEGHQVTHTLRVKASLPCRNMLSDFADVRRSGIIAMKLEDGKAIVDVQICTERDDVLLTAAGGQCIRVGRANRRGRGRRERQRE